MHKPERIAGIRRYWYWWLAGLVVCLAAALVFHRRSPDPTQASRPFRIGFQNSLPFQSIKPDGSPTGPAVEIVAEAARRAHIPVEWVYSPDGPEPNLKSGRVDLWPLLGDVGDRRKFLYISEPWLSNSFWLVSWENSAVSTPASTAGHTVHLSGV